MTNARTRIFAKLRQAKNRQNTADADSTSVEQWLTRHTRGPLPVWATPRDQRFIAKVNAVAGTVTRINSTASLVPAVCDYLASHNLPQQLVIASSPILEELAWPGNMTTAQCCAMQTDDTDNTTALSVAYAAIAETGSLVLMSGPDTPASLNFLPNNYLCVLYRNRIVNYMEDIWDLVRCEQCNMPRAVNFITGPSRTADVEQTIQLGAHGPRQLHVLLLE